MHKERKCLERGRGHPVPQYSRVCLPLRRMVSLGEYTARSWRESRLRTALRAQLDNLWDDIFCRKESDIRIVIICQV